MADYIICGGGIGGCVLVSRLHEKYPSSSIILIEAGADVSEHPLIVDPAAPPMLQKSELD
jgi:L-2-hydroxyglutarate oxidase LhgO